MHVNAPICPGCEKVINKYPGFDPRLYKWYQDFRTSHPDGHVSWAGRGKVDQELFFNKGMSRAHWKQSAHNYNMALDWFRLGIAGADFSTDWFRTVLGPAVLAEEWLVWYGKPGSKFYEFPHVEIKDWSKDPNKKLVES